MPSDWFQAETGERIAMHGGRFPVLGPQSPPGDASATRRSYRGRQGAAAAIGQIAPFRPRTAVLDPLQIQPDRQASRTARIPVKKIPSNVPAPPMDAIGAPSPWILSRFNRSAPIKVPRLPAI